MPTTSLPNSPAPTALWYTRCPVPTTSGIAQHFQWLQRSFARQGITLASLRASDDAGQREAHFSHRQANLFREGGNAPPIWARASGQDTVVVGITWVDEEQVILVRDTSPIRSLADLKGSRLGLPKQSHERYVDVGRAQDLRGLLTALRLAGLSRDEVQFIDIDSIDGDGLREGNGTPAPRRHAGSEALLAGNVDAIYAKGAVSATLLAQGGLRAIVDFNTLADPLARINAGTPRPITVDRALALEHPHIVAHYLAVLLRTAQWAAGHPEPVVKAIAAETGATPEAVRRAYGPALHTHFDVNLSAPYVAALEQQKDFFLAEGFLPADFAFKDWIVRAPLELARTLVAGIVLDEIDGIDDSGEEVAGARLAAAA